MMVFFKNVKNPPEKNQGCLLGVDKLMYLMVIVEKRIMGSLLLTAPGAHF